MNYPLVFIIYAICGILFDLFMGWIITALERINEEDMSHLRFNNTEKLLNLVIWPYHLIVFLYGMFFGNEDELDEE